jgi:hypothetical protein
MFRVKLNFDVIIDLRMIGYLSEKLLMIEYNCNVKLSITMWSGWRSGRFTCICAVSDSVHIHRQVSPYSLVTITRLPILVISISYSRRRETLSRILHRKNRPTPLLCVFVAILYCITFGDGFNSTGYRPICTFVFPASQVLNSAARQRFCGIEFYHLLCSTIYCNSRPVFYLFPLAVLTAYIVCLPLNQGNTLHHAVTYI